VTDFHTVKEAKDFLANRIAAEAAQENVPLSEVERKMLYFSETDWTLPDMMTVSDEFDRDYDQDEYEKKIAVLIANITTDHHHKNEDEKEKWDAAVEKLSDGDHYIQVLVGNGRPAAGGFFPTGDKPAIRPRNDFLKLLLTAFALIFAFFALFALSEWFFATRLWTATGWDISDHTKGFLLVVILAAGAFLVQKLWGIIRGRLERP